MFIVKTIHKGNPFWLRGTTWAFYEDHAQRFDTRAEAQAKLDKSKQFNQVAAYKAAVIQEVA